MEIIHQNNMIARAMLEEPLTDEQSEKIEKRYQENKRLMKENSESIQLQYEITKFIENHLEGSGQKKREALGAYSHRQDAKSAQHSMDEILRLTIEGEIPFNCKHPFFRDEEFFARLLKHYQYREDYETCQSLLKQRSRWQGN